MVIKSILNFPRLFFKKINTKFRQELNEIKNSESKRKEKLLLSYKLVGLSTDREKHIQHLNNALKDLGLLPYDEANGMYSEHLIIFSAMSNSDFKPKNILEIGTYDGKTAAILSKLFPYSNINTIDLNERDIMFKTTYNRDSNINEFLNNRNNIIDNQKNINFIKSNSLQLTFSEKLINQDLIWVDGAHGYPIVTSDITNCLRLLNKGGILMCDDVWKKIKENDKIYSSIATYETLSSYAEANIIDNIFFRKRLGKKYNGNYKYISFTRFLDDFISNIE